mmetsp:Transcript_13162/g.55287  ORF Transcript_13162/g.55287 Transcript_13162/m.55287 type:complete len:253 (+) Transcript_13162:3037-3795(+)
MASTKTAHRSARTSISAAFARSPAMSATAHAALDADAGASASDPRRAAATHVPMRCATRESRRRPASSSRSAREDLALSATTRSMPAAMSGETRRRPASSNPRRASLGVRARAETSFFTTRHSSTVMVHCVAQSSSDKPAMSTRHSPSPAAAVISSSSSETRRPGKSSYARAAERHSAFAASSPFSVLRLRRHGAGATGGAPRSLRNCAARWFASRRARCIHSPSSPFALIARDFLSPFSFESPSEAAFLPP